MRQVEVSEAAAVLALVQVAFAEQAGRIDPPSSMNSLSVLDVETHLETDVVWADNGLIACMFGTAREDSLYLSKLSVHPDARGRGLAGQLMDAAEAHAKAEGFKWLEVIARIELAENHRFFEHLGFQKFADGRHDGYDRTTEFHFRKPV